MRLVAENGYDGGYAYLDQEDAIRAVAEITNLRSRVKELEIMLGAWHEAFGTTQLTHAMADRDALVRRAEMAEDERNENEGIFKIWRRRCEEADRELDEALGRLAVVAARWRDFPRLFGPAGLCDCGECHTCHVGQWVQYMTRAICGIEVLAVVDGFIDNAGIVCMSNLKDDGSWKAQENVRVYVTRNNIK